MSKVQIEPRVLKGFRDLLPQVTIPRAKMLTTIQEVFTSFGFPPIDTPAMEYTEILLGKGGEETDKQLYRFLDNGGRDVALRFDLTVPFARFMATHINELGVPFKRYHIAPVWRAEKPQRGRYREFVQCDFDIIGTRSILSDSESLAVVNKTLNALDIKHRIRINNRLILNGFLESLAARERSQAIMRAIDKLEKLGKETVEKELSTEAQLEPKQIERVFAFVDLSKKTARPDQILSELASLIGDTKVGEQGVQALGKVIETLPAYGIKSEEYAIDLSIARGLDYYTGTVFETTMVDMPEIGSICSGGRYDDLASLYINRELPGVGGSIGLDRILGAFAELGRTSARTSPAEVLVTILDEGTETRCIEISEQIRRENIPTELFPDPSQLGGQLKYADRRGIPWVVIAGSRELVQNVFSLKNLKTGEQHGDLPIKDAGAQVRRLTGLGS